MSSSAAGNGSAVAAPSAMPPSLRALVSTVERLTESPTTITQGGKGEGGDEHQHLSSSPPAAKAVIATTDDLLKLVETSQQHYMTLLELSERGFSSSAPGAHDGQHVAHLSVLSSAQEDSLRVETATHAAALEETVSALQRGIRSKLAQSSRLVLLNALRREVAERRQCVAKMEGALSVARQHAQL